MCCTGLIRAPALASKSAMQALLDSLRGVAGNVRLSASNPVVRALVDRGCISVKMSGTIVHRWTV